MYKSKIIIALLLLISSLWAEESRQFLNALGWDNGGSYKRILPHKFWIGLTIGGNIYHSNSSDTIYNSYHYTSPDTFFETITIRHDSTISYMGSVTLAVGKELFRFEYIGFDAFVSGGYIYQANKSIRNGTMESSFSQPDHTMNASIGFEPKIWILNDRFSFGSKFGVAYRYMFGDDNNSQSYSNPNSTNSTVKNGSNSGYQLSTFGNFSLSMAFIGFIYF